MHFDVYDSIKKLRYRINNNVYSAENVGIIGSNTSPTPFPTLSDWSAEVKSDSNSIVTDPIFKDIDQDLQLVTYFAVRTAQDSIVKTDIEGKLRDTLTACGAYGAVFANNDATLSDLQVAENASQYDIKVKLDKELSIFALPKIVSTASIIFTPNT